MEDLWAEATFLLEVLVMKAKHLDKDGMDLYFTTGQPGVLKSNKHTDFAKIMNQDQYKPTVGKRTNMKQIIERLLREYLHNVEGQGVKNPGLKDLTIIVLTDGKWEGMADSKDVETAIKSFDDDWKSVRGKEVKRRPVGKSSG